MATGGPPEFATCRQIGFGEAQGASAGLAATVGGIGSYALVGVLGFIVYTKANAGWFLPVEGGAEVLADTISNLMLFAAAGLVSAPVGIVVAVIGALGWARHRTPQAPEPRRS